MPVASFDFEAIGTAWHLDIFDYPPAGEGSLLLKQIHERIAQFDRNYSRFRTDSLVADMARASGTYQLPPDAQPLFDLYQTMYRLTDGLMTPLIGNVMVEAGYDATYSLIPKELHHPPLWEEALEYRFPELLIKKPALLDIGALGKGYLIDIVGTMLSTQGLTSFSIDAGGDILHRDPTQQPLKIGLENPSNTSQIIGVAELRNASICGSAGNRRAWDRFHHIINPRTLESPRHILATWAVATTALLADAIATGLFFVPAEKLRAVFPFEYVIVYADQSVELSPEFPGTLFAS